MSSTLPYRWYTDEAVLQRERERLFAGAWQYVGHTGELAEPGSYLTCRVGLVPIVVVRDREGGAFVNVCRHRGAEVVSGAGRCTTLQCHYHAWTYGLDGSLRAAPRANLLEAGFDRAALGLRPAPLERWGAFVFVNADPDAAPLADTLGELPELVRRAGLDVDTLAFHSRARYSLQANWKVAVENYLECYHCAVAHPSFSDAVDVAPGTYRLETHPNVRQPLRGRARGRDGDGGRDRGPVPPREAEPEGQRHARPAEHLARPARPGRAGAHRRLPGLLLRARRRPPPGSPTSSSSTTRSGPRTGCSWSPSSAGWARAPSSTGGCCCPART